MYKHPLKLFTLISALFYACLPGSGLAVLYYENNFESGTIPKFHPDIDAGQIWTLAPTFDDFYGTNNHFNISSSTAHNGSYSLRFTYEAQNGFCNTCGSKFVDHIAKGHDGVTYVIADDGADLSITDNPDTTKKDDGPKAQPGKFLYNRNGGFSKWEIISVSSELNKNDRINLKLVTKGINGEDTINGGDSIAITRQCGVDGIIGLTGGENDISRRSDCNNVVMWFANVTPQLPGESIYRRVYLKAEITSPNVRQKLHYLRPDRGGPLQGEIVIFAHSAGGNVVPQVSGTSKYGSAQPIYVPGNGLPNDLSFERGVWYYVEEQYRAATKKIDGTYNNDGLYRLWFSKAGDEPVTEGNTTFEITGLALPPIVGGNGTHISFWGNLQHDTHARGSWYIDDVIVTDIWTGAVPQDKTDLFSSKPPAPE